MDTRVVICDSHRVHSRRNKPFRRRTHSPTDRTNEAHPTLILIPSQFPSRFQPQTAPLQSNRATGTAFSMLQRDAQGGRVLRASRAAEVPRRRWGWFRTAHRMLWWTDMARIPPGCCCLTSVFGIVTRSDEDCAIVPTVSCVTVDVVSSHAVRSDGDALVLALGVDTPGSRRHAA